MTVYKRILPSFVLGLAILMFRTAQAEPYLAVREGLMCSACHVNQTGLGKRNQYGVEYSQSDLPINPTRSAQQQETLNRYLNDFVSIGGDVRVTHNTRLPKAGGAGITNTLQFFEANIYAEVTLKRDRLTFYLDEQFAPTAGNREAVGILHGLPGNGYIKAGKFFLPYGWRLWDFESYIQGQTPMLSSDFGVEFGVEPGSVSFQVAVTNGEPFQTSDSNDGKQLTMRLATVHARGRIGGSFSINTEDPFVAGREEARVMGGPFVGVSGGPIALLGEYDLIRSFDAVTNDHQIRKAGYGELNLLLSQGVNAKVAFDYFDPDNGAKTAKRFRIGLEPTINEFMQARVFYNLNRPRNFPDPLFGFTNPNQDLLSLELHVMF